MTIDLGDGLQVSPLGFGGMALTPVYGPADPVESLATLNHAVDAGITFIDTANVYGMGANEELIAELLKDRREEVQLATKFGIAGNPATGEREVRADPAYVRESAAASLKRLNTEVIDLYYLHRLDPRVPIEETVGAMAELVQEGKVRHLGLSEVTASELERAVKVHPIAAVQSEWSIWSRDVERSVVPTAARLGVGFVPYSPLGRGFLTGTVNSSELAEGDIRRRMPRFVDGAVDANQTVVEVVVRVAGELSSTEATVTPAQVALAWLLAQGGRLGLPVVPIPGTRRASRIDENLGAISLTLSDTQLSALDQAAEAVVGSRSDTPSWVSYGRE
ncbi:aldo/keto reductase [Psychromicrobium sp. YIM B11713]|uniref:aldo/keto reductase n=1 Tax=Psychromicrobium sp. YIM B11713 TaxID=3145233 RepID=UPI00374F0EDA